MDFYSCCLVVGEAVHSERAVGKGVLTVPSLIFLDSFLLSGKHLLPLIGKNLVRGCVGASMWESTQCRARGIVGPLSNVQLKSSTA